MSATVVQQKQFLSQQQQQSLAPSFYVLLLVTGLVAAAFWFFTTEVIAVRVSSGQWWFYLVFAFLLLFMSIVSIFRSYEHGGVKVASLLFGCALMGTLVYLGVKHQPLSSENLKFKIGLTPAFSGFDGVPVQSDGASDTDAYEEPRDAVNLERFLPPPIDQGRCGSCWAVAGATAISARYGIYLEKEGRPQDPNAVESVCAPASINAAKWHISPQYLLDRDEWRTPDVDPGTGVAMCSADDFGKCNGNTQISPFELAKAGAADLSCVPYFAGDGPSCKSGCGSPVDNEYYECPGGNRTTQCLKDTPWTSCADNSPLRLKVETYDVKHVIGEYSMKREVDNYGPILCGINFYTKANGANAGWTLDDKSSLWGKYADMISRGYVARPAFDGDDYRKDFNEGGHALVVYGYGEHQGVPYWLARNSWGPNWGDNGTIKIERGIDAWNIESFCATAKVRDYSGSNP